jgi:flagellar protein FliS
MLVNRNLGNDMTSKAARAYASNENHGGVISSEPSELVVLVYERILDHLKVGKKMLEDGDYGVDQFTKANDLIQKGLLACLDHENGGDISLNLGAIYEWSLREIVKARLDRSPQKVQEVIDMLTSLYEAWLSLAPKEQLHSVQDHQSSTKSGQLNSLSVVNA